MSYSIETYSSPPTVVITLNENFDIQADTRTIAAEFDSIAQNAADDVILIIDFRPAAAHLDLENIMLGPSLATQADNPIFNHPKVRELLFVAVSDAMKHVVAGLNTMYADVSVQLFSSVEDALDYAQAS